MSESEQDGATAAVKGGRRGESGASAFLLLSLPRPPLHVPLGEEQLPQIGPFSESAQCLKFSKRMKRVVCIRSTTIFVTGPNRRPRQKVEIGAAGRVQKGGCGGPHTRRPRRSPQRRAARVGVASPSREHGRVLVCRWWGPGLEGFAYLGQESKGGSGARTRRRRTGPPGHGVVFLVRRAVRLSRYYRIERVDRGGLWSERRAAAGLGNEGSGAAAAPSHGQWMCRAETTDLLFFCVFFRLCKGRRAVQRAGAQRAPLCARRRRVPAREERERKGESTN